SGRARNPAGARGICRRVSAGAAGAPDVEEVREGTGAERGCGPPDASFVWSAGLASGPQGRAIRIEDFAVGRRAASRGSVSAGAQRGRDSAGPLPLRRRRAPVAGAAARGGTAREPETTGGTKGASGSWGAGV